MVKPAVPSGRVPRVSASKGPKRARVEKYEVESDEEGTGTSRSPEKYRKYRAKQKEKLLELTASLEALQEEVEHRKSREMKLLYLLLLSSKQVTAKESEIARLRGFVDDRRLGMLSMVATGGAATEDAPAQPAPTLPTMGSGNASFMLAASMSGTGGDSGVPAATTVRPSTLTRDNSLPSSALQHRPSFTALAAMPSFADDILERAFPDEQEDELRDSLLDAFIADQMYTRLTRGDSMANMVAALGTTDRAGSESRAGETAPSVAPLRTRAGSKQADARKPGFFSNYFKACADATLGGELAK